jgi:hypothetical protein
MQTLLNDLGVLYGPPNFMGSSRQEPHELSTGSMVLDHRRNILLGNVATHLHPQVLLRSRTEDKLLETSPLKFTNANKMCAQSRQAESLEP